MIGKKNGWLYLLSSNLDKDTTTLTATHTTSGVRNSRKLNVYSLHQILGHVSSSVLNKLLNIRLADITQTINKCIICPCAKQARLSFPISTSTNSNTFDLLHMDIWGPYNKSTFDGY